MVGTFLRSWFTERGHTITPVVRRPVDSDGAGTVVRWHPSRREIDHDGLEGHDLVIHLAGANIAGARWTTERKKLIRRSRVEGTAFLAETLAALKTPPPLFLKASAIGFYGNRDSTEAVDESSPPGEGFLPEVCIEWERAADPARAAGIRVIDMRFGIIQSPGGGALGSLLPIFRLGAGGRIGSGRQVISWIALGEIGPAIEHCIKQTDLSGPVNFVSPQAVTNAEYTRILGRVLRRPTIFPVPEFAARTMFGEMAEWLLLGGARVLPGRLEQSGYRFTFPELEGALRSMLAG